MDEWGDRTFTIKQVRERLQIPDHTLRFWEQELPGILSPWRTPGGQRRYGPEHLALIARIDRMRKAGLGLPEVRRRLARPGGAERDLDGLAARIAEVVKAEVFSFLTRDG